MKARKAPIVRMRIVLDDGVVIGPGKADLLAAIDECGSIAAAGRSMNMSYHRAWSLVDELNGLFREPLVELSRGGNRRGGATLTDTGRFVLERYRGIEAATADSCREELRALSALVRR